MVQTGLAGVSVQISLVWPGRVARFTILSILVIAFGPQVVGLVTNVVKNYPMQALAVIAVAVLVGVLIWKLRQRRTIASPDAASEN